MAQTVKINGKVYDEVKAFEAVLASDPSKVVTFPDTSDGTLDASKMTKGMKGYSGGVAVTGTAAEIGEVNKTLDANTMSYDVPKGFTEGGTVQIVPETKSVTPAKEDQIVKPESGKLITQVNIGKIPDKYQDISGVTAEEEHVTAGKIFVKSDGSKAEGTHTDPIITLANNVLSIR